MTWPMRRERLSKPLARQVPNPRLQIPSKCENPNPKDQSPNSKTVNVENPHRRDLEDRTLQFAQAIRNFVKNLPRNISNMEDVRQLVRASGSVAANWIEADEALSKKDFLMRVKICRKEAKESRLFLRLIDAGLTKEIVSSREGLAKEARELTLIFSAIISKSSGL